LLRYNISITEDMRTAGMVAAARSDIFDDPCDVLSFRISLARRQHTRRAIDLSPVWNSVLLASWSLAPESAILLIQGSLLMKLETLAVATTMAEIAQSEQVTVLWALQNADPDRSVETTPAQLMKYLTMQALRQNHDTVNNHISQSFDQTHIASAYTVQHWTSILSNALRGVPRVYVLIDLDLMNLEDPSTTIAVLLQSLSGLTLACKPTILKIALVNKLRTVVVDLGSTGAETLNLEKLLPNNTRISRVRGRRQANNAALRGRGSLAFRSRLRGQQ
jgi:hypothetical protein